VTHPSDTDVRESVDGQHDLRHVWGPPGATPPVPEDAAGPFGTDAAGPDTTQRVEHPGAREDVTRRFGPAPGPPPPVPPPTTTDESSARRPGLPLRSYLAVALTAALGAGVVVVPTQLLTDDAAETATASSTTEEGTVDTTLDEGGAVVEPLPGAQAGSQIAAIAERLKPSVVRIETEGGSGSGVVLDSDGNILTNAHVVDGADTVTVQTPDGKRLEGQVVGADENTDVAVVRVEESLPVPSYSTTEPTVGEAAIAIGSPFGLDSTVTSGIVSATGRQLNAGDVFLFDLVQTDAAINPGNSGGALVNGRGQVIGINTAILSRSGANDGIGFAIPSITALSVANDLLQFGEVRAGWLGVQGQTIDQEVAELYDLKAERGAVIVEVLPDTPAEAAGLQEGDMVIAVDDEEVTSMLDLASIVRNRDPGDEVTLTILRGDQEIDVQLVLGDRPADLAG
jgi:S1-C subfamily serine protease